MKPSLLFSEGFFVYLAFKHKQTIMDLKDVFKNGFDKGGKPRIIKTAKELIEGINSYYNSIVKTRFLDEPIEGQEVAGDEYFCRPTVTGLALHLGYATRQSIYDNQKNEEYSYILKKAVTFIEQYHEEALDSKNVAGHVFALKNMGWTDKTEVETTTIETPLTKEERAERIKALKEKL